MRIRRLCAVTVVLAVAVSLVACGGQRQANSGDKPGGRLTIATGNTTGVYYQLGGALASLISSKVEGYRATASETGASVQNVQGLTAGNYDIAFSLGDTAADAVKGQHSFKTPQDVVKRLYDETQKAIADPGVKERLAKLAIEPLPMSQPEFQKYFEADVKGTDELAKKAGIEKQ